MENNLKYIVYLTTNQINNKIYIGVHQTYTPDEFDGYLGNQTYSHRPSTYNHPTQPFQYAVKKYGPKNFKRVTLAVFDDLNDALKLEKILVNKAFIKRRDTYNVAEGGGLPADSSIELFQYSTDGTFIKSWKNSVEPAHYFNVASNNIRMAVKLKCMSCGYLWTEYFTDKLDISEFKITEQHERVYKFNELNEIVDSFETIVDAAKDANSTPRLILFSIAGRTKNKGFYYSYDENFKIDMSVYNKLTDVYLYNLDGSFFKHFSSPCECADYFGDLKTSKLYSSIRTGGLFHGYQVSKENVECMKEMEKCNTPKKVGRFDKKGNLLQTWDTIQSAFLEYGHGVKKCLKGAQNTTKGFVFKYI